MDYDAVLAQVVTLLQQEQRVAYRVLKRRLQLDDELLEDLKDDLIYAKKLAVDEDGRVLVWTGGTSRAPRTTPSAPQAVPSTVPQEAHPAQAQVASAVPSPAPDAERRQLTVLFCDLVDSTALSGQLDPEDLRDVVRAYQQVCSEVITRFEGHIAQLLGDGLLVYFGYPQAHEDDAHRAVRTGLGILEAMGDLHKRLEQEKGITLALRLGIHTGLVVVGAMGGGGRQEQLALGETPNVAARIQGLAAPNTVVMSDATSRLVQGYFQCQDLGAQALRGVTESMRVYHVLCESGATSRLDVAQPRGLTPLVGRESEVALLLERWEQVKAGHGQVVLLTGEAGIGKSRLVQVLKDHVANEPHVRWECRSAEYAQNTILFPLVDLFQRLLQFQAEDTSDEKLRKLEHALGQYRLPLEDSVLLFAPLLSLAIPEDRYPPLHVSPQRQRQKTLEALVAIMLELAEPQPMLFILEDLHWTDPSTLELLGLLLDQTPTAALLVLLMCRPHFQPAWHHRSYLTEMTLNHLSHAQVEQLVAGITDGKTFPAEVLQQILAKADGVPLFVEEITKVILESGQLTAVNGQYERTASFSTFAIPATLQDSLMARLDRLVTAKGVAQMGATIGRQFAYDLLQAVSQLDASTLQRELGRLVEAEIVYQRGLPPQATYMFKHALIQDAAYQSLLKSTRQQYHQRIAEVLVVQFPETAEAQPELLAHHYTEAGLLAQAVGYWYKAGQRAMERSAYVEAIAHLTRELEVLTALPETPESARQELTLHITLAPALMVAKGLATPEVERAYSRALALCRQVGETPQLFPVLVGLWRFHAVRAEYQTARELEEWLLRLAQSIQDPALLLEAYRPPGQTLFLLGELVQAREHLEQALALYDPEQHRSHAVLYGNDAGVMCLSWLSLTLWLLGYPEQARTRSHEALTLAQDLAHPPSLAAGLHFAPMFHQLCREGQATQERAEAAILLATEQGMPVPLAMGTILWGWALVKHGRGAEGLGQIRQGLAAYRATGMAIHQPHALALLAEAYGDMEQVEEGLTALVEALAVVEQTGERFYEAELHRLKGTLLLARSSEHEAEAEACFQHALAIARQQQARSLELRAATSLARLWQQQGKRDKARQVLGDVYRWFTEGFDTLDLQDAKALLAMLGEEPRHDF